MTFGKKAVIRGALGAASAVALLGATGPASAAVYIVNFTTLNNSGVSGSALLDLDAMTKMLTVTFNVSGLDTAGGHVAHIHGLFTPSGQAKNSKVPTLAVDADNDGFIEVPEGAATYGEILLPLGDIGTDSMGVSTFSMSYDLSDQSIFNEDFDYDDLVPFQLREVVIHGLTVPDGAGAGTGNEVNGSGGFIAALPVAAGEITPGGAGAVPEPAAWALLVLGFGAIGGSMRQRKRLRLRTA